MTEGFTTTPSREFDNAAPKQDPAADIVSRRELKPLRDLHGPRGWPFVGNAFQIDGERLPAIFEKWTEQHGSLFKIVLMGRPVVVASDPETVRKVLKERPHAFRRWSTIEPVFKEIGLHGLFSAEGDMWRTQRPLVSQALSLQQIRTFFPKLKDITERLKRRWEAASRNDAEIDVQDDFMRFTVDVTFSYAFSYDINSIEDETADFHSHLERLLPTINHRLTVPFPYWHYFKRASDRELDRSIAKLRALIDGITDESRKRLAAAGDDATAANFLESMLLTQAAEKVSLSNEDIFGNILTLMVAGEDTTANTLAWTTHFLVENPGVFARLREELDPLLGSDTIPDLERLPKTPFLDAIINESLRLKPVAPIYYMTAAEDTEFDGFAVPAGTTIMLQTRIAALKDANGAPSNSFDPDRWLDPGEAAHLRQVAIPFGFGPRMCPGRSLGLFEARSVLAMIARNFDLVPLPDRRPVEEIYGFTLIPRTVRLKVRSRSEQAGRESAFLQRGLRAQA